MTKIKNKKSFCVSQKKFEIFDEWNKTEKDYPQDKTLQQLFEEQVDKSPNTIAVTCEEIHLTYKELDEKANKLAHYIKENSDIKPDKPIALCLDRNEHVLIAILGVLKAGGAYVPIDPEYPIDRIKYILKDVNPALILTNTTHKQRLEEIITEFKNEQKSEWTQEILALDALNTQAKLDSQAITRLNIQTTSKHLAYIIYTSGTTGKPKGVMIEHRSLVNLILAVQDIINVGKEDNFIFYRSYAFDGVIEETLLPLVSGARLNICPEGLKDLKKFFDILKENNISIANINSETAQALGPYISKDLKLKKIISGGTKLNLKSFAYFINNNITIFNSYGPTECTVDATYYRVNSLMKNYIGMPIANNKVYVLGESLEIIPIGTTGELYIGGDGVARGYLNQPILTAERFIKNPFQTEEEKKDKSFGLDGRNSRIYKTGDLVRWLANGNLEYIERNDFQVKIRGYRIELGEIESAISEYEGVKYAIVLVKERTNSSDGEVASKYLVGYYVSGIPLNEEKMLSYLEEKLPDYMVPSALVYLAHLPLTLNGKLDRKALPDPIFTDSKSYVAPRNELEKEIVKIWAEILGLSKEVVGIEDDFFRLGGDSIISIQIVSRLRQRLGLRVSVKDIFIYKTIKMLCDIALSEIQNKIAVEVETEQGILSGAVPLLPIQKWFFDSNFIDNNYWNQAFIIKTPILEMNRLKESITKLVEHHDAFRLRYKKQDTSGEYVQFYDIDVKVPEIKLLDVSKWSKKTREHNIHSILSNWQSSFNLEKGPIASIGYLYGYDDGSARIFFAFHHLIIDTVSWRIITEDLIQLYDGKSLEQKGSSYRQWTKAVMKYAEDNLAEKKYWNEVIRDYEGEKIQYEKVSHCMKFKLNKEQTKLLLQESNRTYHTQINDILLTAFGYALQEITGSKINYIVLEGHGREEISASIDITKTLGWFTTMYPVKLEMKDTLKSSIISTKENLRKIPNKGIGYGAIYGYQNSKLPRICFNYLGQFEQQEERKQQASLWSISGENAGEWINKRNDDYNIINVTGLVIDECLEFKIVNKLNQEIANKLSNQFKLALENIISHTIKNTRSFLTASDVQNIVSQSYLDEIQKNKEIDGVYKANSLQQGFIYHNLAQGDKDDAYRVQLIWQYQTVINPYNLKIAWEHAQKKYDSLRLRFGWKEELVQIIDKIGRLDWSYIDLSNEKDIETLLEQIQKKDREKVYNLEDGSLFRIILIKQKESLYTCILSNHHAILDGWSNSILIGYVHETYLKLEDKIPFLLEVDSSYGASQKYIQENRRVEEEAYWQNYMFMVEEKENLNSLLKLDKQKVKLRDYKYIINEKEKTLEIKDSDYENLKTLSRENSITINAILQYVWHKALSIYGNTNYTTVGITISGRTMPINDIEYSVGLYINTLPLTVNHSNVKNQDRIILDAIKEISKNINEINSKSSASLAYIQKGGERLFDCLFVYENYPNTIKENQINRLRLTFKGSIEKLDYPLAIIIYEERTKLIFNLRYAGELFDEVMIEKLLQTVNCLIDQIISNIYASEKELRYTTEEDYNQIVHLWNNTTCEYQQNKTIHELFDAQANEAPLNIAIIEGSFAKEYTYKTLKNDSDFFAKYILNYQNTDSNSNRIQVDNRLIGILSEKGYKQVVSVLSTLKSGRGYLPLNGEWPVSRINEILNSAKVKTLLISKYFYNKKDVKNLLDSNYQVFIIEEVLIASARNNLLQNPLKDVVLPKVSASDIAYVIFTSGSTGTPKGVTISHSGALNTIYAINQKFDVTSQDKVLALSELSFDLSVYDIFGLLIEGGTVVLPAQNEVKNPTHWAYLFSKYNITIWNSVPQLAGLFVEELQNKQYMVKSVRLFLLSGDWIPINLSDSIKDSCHMAEVISLGGATEASIWSVWYKIDLIKKHWSSIPYGMPMPNQSLYILNSYDEICPIGAVGEIHIGGMGIALDYWQDPERTEKSFIIHNDFKRLYKTGDIGRWNKEGYIEILGRKDEQIKINGYRIELGEIESAISEYEGVKHAIVLAKEPVNSSDEEAASKYLVGYYVSDTSLNEKKILSFLQKKLPEYMIPKALVYLAHLPLTVNGKVDRKSLPNPTFTNSKSYVAPRNELEKEIVKIWAEILGLSNEIVGIEDDFFRLGGNSISAIRLVSRINKNFNQNLNIASIFQNRTIIKILSCFCTKSEINTPIKMHVKDPKYQKLSFSQERLWFIEKYENGTNAYNVPIVAEIADTVSLDLLKKSINSIVKRHDVLKTCIKEDSTGGSYQVVSDFSADYLTEVKIKDTNELHKKLKEDVNYVYDLTNEYPIKAKIYILDSSKKWLSVVIHHIAFDGWSAVIFLQELREYYRYYTNQDNSLVNNNQSNLPDLSVQYIDFALWQRNYLAGDILDKQTLYWKNKLDDYQNINLITDYTRPLEIDYRGSKISFSIDKKLSLELRQVAKELHVSLYSLLLSAYFLMLRAYTNQDDIVVGTPVANRHYPQIENLIGFFVNILAIRIKINDKSDLLEFIKYVSSEIIESQLNQDLPFEKLVEELNIEKDKSRHPIFQVMFGVQGFKHVNDEILTHLDCDKYYNVAKFDIETFIDDSDDILKGSFNYRVNLYKEETIKCFISTYIKILNQIGEFSQVEEKELAKIKVEDIKYLNDKDYHLIINEWNNTYGSYPHNKTIHELFEEQATKTPYNRAVVYKNTTISYKKLNKEANKLANYLIKKFKYEPNNLVALFLDRSEKVVISILSTLKAGKAYVPIDPAFPDERILYILKDTDAKVIIVNQIYENRIKALNLNINIISIDSKELQIVLKSYKSTNLDIPNTTSANLAYVIYTSGTTGKPKGVMIEHKSVVNLALMQGKKFGLSSINNVDMNSKIKNCLCYANYVFDASVSEIFTGILSGNTIHILSDNERFNLENLDRYINDNNIDIATIPPALLTQKTHFPRLKTIVVAGESISNKTYHYLQRSNNKVINAYGPTEVTVCSSLHCYNKNDIPSNIGSPLPNVTCYVLSSNCIPLPVGAIGELYIGGVGIARGYLNNSELTKNYFIPNIFQTEEEFKDKYFGPNGRNSRLYRTGDLVRWLPTGELEYIGRNDTQVKIRGHRIELKEIENVFITCASDINQCVVLVQKNTNKIVERDHIVAYYTTSSGKPFNEDELFTYLSSKLPALMVPKAIVFLDKFKLTTSGKVDIKFLTTLEMKIPPSTYLAPRSVLETKMRDIFAELLGINSNNLSIQDDFFRIGGDSIASIQLTTRLRQELNLNTLSVRDIFDCRTIGNLYDKAIKDIIDNSSKKQVISEQGILSGDCPLLPIQQWFFDNKFAVPYHWNQSFIIKTPELDLDVLQESIEMLVNYHDAFRFKYTNTNSQYYDNTLESEKIKILNINTLSSADQFPSVFTLWQSSFDLQHGPLYSICYLHGYDDGSARIFFAFHHLIIDTVSWRILSEDLKDIYYKIKKKQYNSLSYLETKGSSYRQWVNVVNSYRNNFNEETNYWDNIISGIQEKNKNLEYISVASATSSTIVFSDDITHKLLKDSSKAYNTEINDLLLAALALTLNETLENRTNYITLEGHGREEGIGEGRLDISRTMGWFTTMYPVRLDVRSNKIGEVIRYIKETLRQIPNKGIGFGSSIGYNLETLPKISFNYLGQFFQNDEIANIPNTLEDKENYWKIVGESSGLSISDKNDSKNIIEINGAIISTTLEFSIKSKLEPRLHDSLVNNFKKNLEDIVNHLVRQSFVKNTMSDYPDFQPYIICNKKSALSNDTVFIMPPGEGGAESYLNNIVPELQSKKLVIFNNFMRYMMNSNFEKYYTYEKLALDYICYIKSVQNNGPYNLFGWSFGGVLAFEITRQLIKQGDVVKNLTILDSYFSFQTAMTKSDIDITIDKQSDINYRYCPLIKNKELMLWQNVNVFLFKANKLEKKNDYNRLSNSVIFGRFIDYYYEINQHYVDKTGFNYLDLILKNKPFATFTMQHSHTSWVNDKNQISHICSVICQE